MIDISMDIKEYKRNATYKQKNKVNTCSYIKKRTISNLFGDAAPLRLFQTLGYRHGKFSHQLKMKWIESAKGINRLQHVVRRM